MVAFKIHVFDASLFEETPNRIIFRQIRAQKNPKNGKSVRKTLKTFNLTTTNVILMRLTTIMYLHESVNRKPLTARNSEFFGVMSMNF